jgi:hypothetical protein
MAYVDVVVVEGRGVTAAYAALLNGRGVSGGKVVSVDPEVYLKITCGLQVGCPCHRLLLSLTALFCVDVLYTRSERIL